MIVATLPEPTVLPPSRFNKYIFRRVFGAFYAIFHGNNMFIAHYLFITLISWHRFGTGILFRQTVRPIGNLSYCQINLNLKVYVHNC